jgi:hypothetical protein
MTTMLPVGTAILMVELEVDPDYEDELHRWMEEEHIPIRMTFPGFLSARRFHRTDVAWAGGRHLEVARGRTYVTIYELESVDALQSPEYLASYDALTDWSRRVSPHQQDVIRSVYATIHMTTP